MLRAMEVLRDETHAFYIPLNILKNITFSMLSYTRGLEFDPN